MYYKKPSKMRIYESLLAKNGSRDGIIVIKWIIYKQIINKQDEH